jgi:hypothetical protein
VPDGCQTVRAALQGVMRLKVTNLPGKFGDFNMADVGWIGNYQAEFLRCSGYGGKHVASDEKDPLIYVM